MNHPREQLLAGSALPEESGPLPRAFATFCTRLDTTSRVVRLGPTMNSRIVLLGNLRRAGAAPTG
jgi:hypothetical protein